MDSSVLLIPWNVMSCNFQRRTPPFASKAPWHSSLVPFDALRGTHFRPKCCSRWYWLARSGLVAKFLRKTSFGNRTVICSGSARGAKVGNNCGEKMFAVIVFLKSYMPITTKLISEIPVTLWKCRIMEILDISYNKLKQVSPGIGRWNHLTILNLIKNNLISLPATMGGLSKLSRLLVTDNINLKFPPATCVSTGSVATLEYLCEHLHRAVQTYWTCLMVVGPENVGKTTLCKIIRQNWRIDAGEEVTETPSNNLNGHQVWKINTD